MAQAALGATSLLTLLDADILIELQREKPEAIAWAKSIREDSFAVPGIAAMELVIGSRDKRERDLSYKFLSQLNIAWPSEADHRTAFQLATELGLSTGLGLADLLIGAQALNQRATLYTFNLKHFLKIQGLDVKAPYTH